MSSCASKPRPFSGPRRTPAAEEGRIPAPLQRRNTPKLHRSPRGSGSRLANVVQSPRPWRTAIFPTLRTHRRPPPPPQCPVVPRLGSPHLDDLPATTASVRSNNPTNNSVPRCHHPHPPQANPPAALIAGVPVPTTSNLRSGPSNIGSRLSGISTPPTAPKWPLPYLLPQSGERPTRTVRGESTSSQTPSGTRTPRQTSGTSPNLIGDVHPLRQPNPLVRPAEAATEAPPANTPTSHLTPTTAVPDLTHPHRTRPGETARHKYFIFPMAC